MIAVVGMIVRAQLIVQALGVGVGLYIHMRRRIMRGVRKRYERGDKKRVVRGFDKG